MGSHYARFIVRFRWLILAFWLAVTAAGLLFLPSLSSVVLQKQTNYLPSSSPVMEASQLADRVNPGKSGHSSAVIAIHHSGGLTPADKAYFTARMNRLSNSLGNYGIVRVVDAANTPYDRSSFISKDETTEIAVVDFPHGDVSTQTDTALANIKEAFPKAEVPSGAQIYFTGDVPIQYDDATISQQGVEKTAGVTVALVLIILLIVFRSLLAPLVTLLTIGVSFLLSSSIVAWLVQYHSFPVSSFTQTFLIAILFGAGTDYSIILLNRFREELTNDHETAADALAVTLQSVFRTVLFSALTVLVSFSVLGLAKFGLYRSAVGVSVGVFIALLAILSFTPALMSVFGRSLFWPRRPMPGSTHPPSRIWGATGRLSTRRPWWVILVLIVVLAPIASLFTDHRTFNPMNDIPNAPSVKGFHVVAKAFGPGHVLPTTFVLRTNQDFRTPKGLASIQAVSSALSAQPGVTSVSSATQPTGKPIREFTLAHQNQLAANGLDKVAKGLHKLSSGLSSADRNIARGDSGLHQLSAGSQQVATGATALSGGLEKAAAGASQLANGGQHLAASTRRLASGAKSTAAGSSQVATATQALANAIAEWSATHPGDVGNPTWQQIEKLAAVAKQGSTEVASGLASLSNGTNQLADGTEALAGNASALAGGLRQLHSGANHLTTGTQQVALGIRQFTRGLTPLSSGFRSADTGLAQLDSGVTQISTELHNSSHAAIDGNPGFYLPASTLEHNVSLKKAMNAYISPGGHVATLTVTLNDDPYSLQAMSRVEALQRVAETALTDSPMHGGEVYPGGPTAVQNALNKVSTADFNRTVLLISSCVFLLLILMLRSIIAPIYIMASLIGTYLVTMGIVQVLTIHVLHQPGLSWPVPFFVFLLLVALGVDYSMFLMSRFDEELHHGLTTRQAMREAMLRMGGVVFSAAIIMAGTFGSLTVAGVTSLEEIGIAIVIGLLIYATVLLGFFVPAAASVIGAGHFWPFARRETDSDGDPGAETPRKPIHSQT
ncbi:MMPL family transporter [Alicyclobacillus sp. SP_1]|uniref:MMPL family transporter n=1 Tax=Alicyclobacillus sp. SP_1 TaxID=2942475 RepID=UPI0021579D31|nr:MMPL family transporter [Alicyclobacillus sp. SP_1]